MKRKTKTKKGGGDEKDEVEELLRAAQDDMLLKLSLDSHLSRVSLGDADIDRRFHALKLKKTASSGAASKAPNASSKAKLEPDQVVDEELKAVLGDDLSARFAALKASLPTPSASSSAAAAATCYEEDDDGDGDDEDEVEKLIRWAKDAARLDPSPPSDDEEGQDTSDQDDDDDDHHHQVDNTRKGNTTTKP